MLLHCRILPLLLISIVLGSLVSNVRPFVTPFAGRCGSLLFPLSSSSRYQRSRSVPTDVAASTQDSSTSSISSTTTGKNTIVYQKVIKPMPNMPENLVLSFLVEYLQDKFELPTNLPMVYEKVMDEDDSKILLHWDSSLSPDPKATKLEVEIVGIFTDEKDETPKTSASELPNMAMVVVQKAADPKHFRQLPPMLQNLFADAESRILKALDRGLDDFMEGKIDFFSEQQKKAESRQTMTEAQENIISELVEEDNVGFGDFTTMQDDDDDDNDHIINTHSNDDVIDVTDGGATPVKDETKQEDDFDMSDYPAVNEEHSNDDDDFIDVAVEKPPPAPPSKEQTAAALESMKAPAKSKPMDSIPQVDFAVRAARKAAERRRNEDFAVRAARSVLQKAQNSGFDVESTADDKIVKQINEQDPADVHPPPSRSGPIMTNELDNGSMTLDPSKMDLRSRRPPMLSTEFSGPRKFRQTFSTPETYAKTGGRRKRSQSPYKADASTASTSSSRAATGQATKKESPQQAKKKKIENGTTKLQSKVEETDNQIPDVDASASPLPDAKPIDPPSAAAQGGERKDDSLTTDSVSTAKHTRETFPADKPQLHVVDHEIEQQKPVDVDLIQNATLRDEIVRETESALDEVAETGEDLSPEELLSRIMKFGDQKEKEEKEGDGFVTGAFEKAKDILREQHTRYDEKPNEPMVGVREQLSEEEELRRMFEAGERIADGRISVASGNNPLGENPATMDKADDAIVDSLIASDRTVSSYAKQLDDELAELEVRINRSPDEHLDGPKKNPVFDVMSGPEVYNPNVTPETVNWPGAAQGTKVVRLPKELDEAITQASFAAEVLQRVHRIKEEAEDSDNEVPSTFTIGKREITSEEVENMRKLVVEAVEIGIIDDPYIKIAESGRLQMVIDELWNQPEERFQEIAESFKDLFLSDNFVPLVRERLSAMADRDLDALRNDDDSLESAHAKERDILGQLVVYAQLLLKEAHALGAELEAQQLEVIRSICKVAMDPNHQSEEEAAMALTDAVRDMRPLFDDAFVAYLKYAVAEEEARLARAGLLDDPEHSRWLHVLTIVQQGVYQEISRGLSRYIDHIGYVLRMETAFERKELLRELIDVMPTLDVRPFVKVVNKIVGSLGDGRKGDFDGIDTLGSMANKILQLHRDVKELLPPERIAIMSKDADEWAAKQKERLLEQRKITSQRLTAARQTEHLDEKIESMGRRGEIERIE